LTTKEITASDTIVVKYKSSIAAGEADTDCPSDKFEIDYFNQTDFDALSDASEKYSMVKPTSSPADNVTHDFTRILIRLNPCSIHEEVLKNATSALKAQKKQIFEAELHMGPTSFITDSVHQLKCSFYQSTSEDTLTVSSQLTETLAAAEEHVEAELKLFKLDANGNKTEVSESSGVLNVLLGETIYLQANIKGDIDVETGFKFCKICDLKNCTGNHNIDLIAQYDGAAEAANEQMNCLHRDIRRNSRFVLHKPSDSRRFAEFQYPAFRYSKSESTAELYLQCQIAICKPDADTACREGCKSGSQGRRRRRRSAAIDPLESTAGAVINILTPPPGDDAECPPPPKAARSAGVDAITPPKCSKGAKLGSICRQECAPGFRSGDADGEEEPAAARLICREQVTERIGAIYFGAAPRWSPDRAACVDVDECLSSPCPPSHICQNTFGSFECL